MSRRKPIRPSGLSTFLDDKKTALYRWAKDATIADGLDDAVRIMGPEKGLPILRDYPDEGAAVMDATGQVHTSPQFFPLYSVIQSPLPGV